MLLDSLGEFEDMPGWAETADGLFDAGLTANPSELHGALVGLMGSGAPLEGSAGACIGH